MSFEIDETVKCVAGWSSKFGQVGKVINISMAAGADRYTVRFDQDPTPVPVPFIAPELEHAHDENGGKYGGQVHCRCGHAVRRIAIVDCTCWATSANGCPVHGA